MPTTYELGKARPDAPMKWGRVPRTGLAVGWIPGVRNGRLTMSRAQAERIGRAFDVEQAAAKRPWWVRDEDAFINAAGFICDGCAHPVAVGTERFAEAHADGCRYIASDTALDRAEAEASNG